MSGNPTLGVIGQLARKEPMTTPETDAGQAMRSTHLLGLDACPLHRKAPFGMTNVSMTHFSIARHYGACVFKGERYTYFPDTDELVRNDVLRWQRRQNRAKPNAEALRPGEAGTQKPLVGGGNMA